MRRTGHRVLEHTGLRSKKTVHKIIIPPRGCHNDSPRADLNQFSRIRSYRVDFLLCFENSYVIIASPEDPSGIPAQSRDHFFQGFRSFRTVGGKIKKEQVLFLFHMEESTP